MTFGLTPDCNASLSPAYVIQLLYHLLNKNSCRLQMYVGYLCLPETWAEIVAVEAVLARLRARTLLADDGGRGADPSIPLVELVIEN